MRAFVVTVLALIGGFFVGIVLSDVIGIIGFRAAETRLLFSPYVLAIVCVVAAPIADVLVRRGSR